MIILKQVYEVLNARLKKVQGIKKIDWYNDQYSNMEEEKATRYPAVYVEILDPINWKQSGDKFQYADLSIRLHCVLFDLKDSPVRTLKFVQDVFEMVNSKRLYDENIQLTTEMVRSATTFPKRYNQVKVATMDLACEVFDISGRPVVEQTNVTGFIIQTD